MFSTQMLKEHYNLVSYNDDIF